MLKLNNKKVQQAVVNVDGGLELLQASGFELVFDDSSPEPQSAASTGNLSGELAHSGSQLSSALPLADAPSLGTPSCEPAGRGQGQASTAVAEVGSHTL